MSELIDIYNSNHEPLGLVVDRERAYLSEGQFKLYVLAIIENFEGQILITQRSRHKIYAAGMWEITGGGVKAGESSREAINREIKEETALDVSNISSEAIYSYSKVNLERGDNYIVDIYHFRFNFTEKNIHLQPSETRAFKLARLEYISHLADENQFLHYQRLIATLRAEQDSLHAVQDALHTEQATLTPNLLQRGERV